MRPYSVALCLVRTSRGIGIAHSDPYLSTATPLATSPADATAADLRSLLEGLPVGVVVLGLPTCGHPSRTQSRDEEEDRRVALAEHLHAGGLLPSSTAFSMWDRRLTAEEIRHHCSTSDLWESISSALRASDALPDAKGACPSETAPLLPELEAAIALQDLLDEEMGGWPNTFG